MPSVSKAQKRFMAAAAHNSDFAAKAGIDQGVAKDFNEADKGRPEPKPERVSRAEKRYGGRNGKT